MQNIKKFEGGPFGDKKNSKNFKNFEQSYSAEILKREDPLGFLALSFAAKYQKNLKVGHFEGKRNRKKVAQCQKK